MTSPCIFCEIVAGRAPASVVGENSAALAFLTIEPLRDGHALVIPRRHVVEYPSARSEELAAIFDLGAEVARRQRRHLGSEGESLFLSSGPAGEQGVGHLHLHVVPRVADDGIDLTRWWQSTLRRASAAALATTARRLSGNA